MSYLGARENLNNSVDTLIKAGRSFALLYLDLDRFVFVNHNFGHLVGDKVITCLDERINAAVGPDGIVTKFSGEEWAIVCYDKDSASNMAVKLLSAITEEIFIDGLRISLDPYSPYLSGSIGISTHPKDGSSCKELLYKADCALFRSKSIKFNDYKFFQETDLAQK